jgi:hypothetical protein
VVITLALGALTACGGGGGQPVVVHASSAPSEAAAIPVTAAATPISAAATPTTAQANDIANRPVPSSVPVTTVELLTPASIEVRDAAGLGWHGVATVVGPGGTRSAPLDGGSATFDGLDEGVYDVTVSRESSPATPGTDGTDVGTANQTLNAGRYGLVAGDHAVVTCDESACTGVL